jgi:hypothetical protein
MWMRGTLPYETFSKVNFSHLFSDDGLHKFLHANQKYFSDRLHLWLQHRCTTKPELCGRSLIFDAQQKNVRMVCLVVNNTKDTLCIQRPEIGKVYLGCPETPQR